MERLSTGFLAMILAVSPQRVLQLCAEGKLRHYRRRDATQATGLLPFSTLYLLLRVKTISTWKSMMREWARRLGSRNGERRSRQAGPRTAGVDSNGICTAPCS
jgi:hypothetical protein